LPAGARGGLVEDRKPGAAQRRGRDAEPLAHAVGVAAHPVCRAGCELDYLEHLADALARTRPVERGEQLEVLAGAEVGIEARRLDEAGDPLQRVRPVAPGIAPEQL